MKSHFTFYLITLLYFLNTTSQAAPANAGKLRISADKAGAYIYINGRKKGMTSDDEGFTSILLAEGEYKVRVEKKDDPTGYWAYSQEKTVFLGADSSMKLKFKINNNRKPTTKGKRLIAKTKADFKNSRYSVHNNGTVTDKKTGLIWRTCSEGQRGLQCERGEVKRYTWKQAKKRASQSTFAGFSDWRLPTIKELNSLVYCSTGRGEVKLISERKRQNSLGGYCLATGYQSPTINTSIFPQTWSFYWSASSDVANPTDAWYVYFYSGDTNAYYKSDVNRVRLVRGGQSF